jgi:hypothetical protein
LRAPPASGADLELTVGEIASSLHCQDRPWESFRVSFERRETMSEDEKENAEKTQAQISRDVFEGMKGRQPRSDQELNDWLASPEGKQATMFEPTSLSRWGETGRS